MDYGDYRYWPSVMVSEDPSEEPVTLAEAKAHLGIDDTATDAQITAQITAAREKIERLSGRCITIAREFTARFAGFTPALLLPMAPVASITAVKYWPSSGSEVTVDTAVYFAETDAEPAVLMPVYNAQWPIAEFRPGFPVSVTYEAGYADTASVPERWKAAIRLQIERDFWFLPTVAGSAAEGATKARADALDAAIASYARTPIPGGVTILNGG